MFENAENPPTKADLTRERLYTIALKMIAKQGFEKTTMRAIAEEAEVAPGAIYYHFKSKESLIQEYYRQSHLDHLEVLKGQLEKLSSFEERLHLVVRSKMDVAKPYKEMARSLFRIAANPDSELSPFSPESRELRLASLAIFEEVVNGAKDSFDPEVKKLLPHYLWLYQMGVILFWIYDSSPDSKRTFQLIDQTVPLIAAVNKQMMSLMARPWRKRILSLLKNYMPDLN